MKSKQTQGGNRTAQIHRNLSLTRQTFELAGPLAKSSHAPISAGTSPTRTQINEVGDKLSGVLVKNESRISLEADDYQKAFNAGVAHAKQTIEASYRKQFDLELEKIKSRQFLEAKETGYAEGRESGYAEGKQNARQEIEAQHQLLEKEAEQLSLVVKSLRVGINEKYLQMQDDLTEICFIGMSQLLVQNIVRPEVIAAKIQSLLQQQISNDVIDVHVHPDDYARLNQWQKPGAEYRTVDFNASHFNLIADPDVKLGGVLMRSGKNSLDARIEYQLEQVKETLLKSREIIRGQNG